MGLVLVLASFAGAFVVYFGARWLLTMTAPDAPFAVAWAGSLVCVVTSFLVATTANLVEGTPFVDAHAVVMEVEPDGPAARAELQPGDRILRIDGEDVTASELVLRLRVVPTSLSCELTLERSGATQALRVTPVDGRIGVGLGEADRLHRGVGVALVGGVVQVGAPFVALGRLFAPRPPSSQPGPIGIVSRIAERGPPTLHQLVAPFTTALVWLALLALAPALWLARRRR